MRVYCINCKWCKYREFASLGVNWGWFCRLKDETIIDSIGHKYICFGKSNCEELNLEFNCSNYKRKWWKFWIN